MQPIVNCWLFVSGLAVLRHIDGIVLEEKSMQRRRGGEWRVSDTFTRRKISMYAVKFTAICAHVFGIPMESTTNASIVCIDVMKICENRLLCGFFYAPI